MDEKSLRSAVIRLAHAKPELRPHLLPILKKASSTVEDLTNRVYESFQGNDLPSMEDVNKEIEKMSKSDPEVKSLLDISKRSIRNLKTYQSLIDDPDSPEILNEIKALGLPSDLVEKFEDILVPSRYEYWDTQRTNQFVKDVLKPATSIPSSLKAKIYKTLTMLAKVEEEKCEIMGLLGD